MDAAAELGRNPVSKHQIQPEYGDEQDWRERDGIAEPVSRDQILRRERDGIAEPVSRDQILRRERGQGKFQLTTTKIGNFIYPVNPYRLLYVMTIHTHIELFACDFYLPLYKVHNNTKLSV